MNTAVLVKTFIYVMLLAIGYTGKRTGLFGRENSKFLNNVICFLTMPAAVINGFQGVEITLSLMAGLGIGLFTNTLLLFLGQFVSRKKTPGERVCTSPVKTDNRKRQPPMVELKHCYRRFCYAKEIYIYQRF